MVKGQGNGFEAVPNVVLPSVRAIVGPSLDHGAPPPATRKEVLAPESVGAPVSEHGGRSELAGKSGQIQGQGERIEPPTPLKTGEPCHARAGKPTSGAAAIEGIGNDFLADEPPESTL